MANGTNIVKKRLGQFIEPFTSALQGGGQTTGGQSTAPTQTPIPVGQLTSPFKQNPFGGVGQTQTLAPTQTLVGSSTSDIGGGNVGGNVDTAGEARVADIDRTLGQVPAGVEESVLGIQSQIGDIKSQVGDLGQTDDLSPTTGGTELGRDASGNVFALDGQGDGRTKDFQDSQAGGQGIDTDTEEFKRLQNEAFQTIIDSQKDIIDAQQSSADRFETRRQQAIQATEAAKKLIQSRFEVEEEEAKKLGETAKTSLLESRRGFATNTAVLSQLEDRNTKRVRDLVRQRDDKLAINDITGAERLDNLIFQEEEALTSARTSYIENAFKTLGAISTAQSGERAERTLGLQEKEFERSLGEANTAFTTANGRRLLVDSQTGETIKDIGSAVTEVGTGVDGLSSSEITSANFLAKQLFGSSAIKTKDGYQNFVQPILDRIKNGESIDAIADDLRFQGQSTEFTGTIRDAAQQITSGLSAGKTETVFDKLDDVASRGDTGELRDFLKKIAVENASGGSQQAKTVMGSERTVEFLDEIFQDLTDYENAGGDTNIFTGTVEAAAAKAGTVKDPELRKIATKITKARQQYRRAMTGVAFSPGENEEYDAIFPNINKTESFNTATIDGLREAMRGDVDFFYSFAMGQNAYNELFKGGSPDKTLGDTTPQPKGNLSNRDFVEQTLNRQGLAHQSVVDNAQKGEIPVAVNATGEVGYITEEEFNNSIYTRI